MSIAFRSKRLSQIVPQSPSEVEFSIHAVDPEAPDQAHKPSEAPESRSSRHAEAPDAGEGRRHYFEQDFTHGRSQS